MRSGGYGREYEKGQLTLRDHSRSYMETYYSRNFLNTYIYERNLNRNKKIKAETKPQLDISCRQRKPTVSGAASI